jgi:hypothetical protein
MALIFRPPVRQPEGARHTADAKDPEKALYRHFHHDGQATNVLITSGVVVEKQQVSVDDIRGCDAFFQGGHDTPVTDVQAVLLTAAGYTLIDI